MGSLFCHIHGIVGSADGLAVAVAVAVAVDVHGGEIRVQKVQLITAANLLFFCSPLKSASSLLLLFLFFLFANSLGGEWKR